MSQHACPDCGESITADPNPFIDWVRGRSWLLVHKLLNCPGVTRPKRLWSWLTRPFRRNRGRTPIYPQWEITGPGSWTLPDYSYPDGPLIPGVDVHLGKRWGQADIDRAAAEGRLEEHMAEHGFYPEGEEPS